MPVAIWLAAAARLCQVLQRRRVWLVRRAVPGQSIARFSKK